MLETWSERLASAVHESGHVVAARYFDITVAYCRIYPDGSGFSPSQTGTNDVRADVKIVINLCGELAEDQYGISVGRPSDPDLDPKVGAHSDRAEARIIALEEVNGDHAAAEEYVRNATVKAKSIIAIPEVWEAIETLAWNLSTNGTVSGSEIMRIVDPLIS